MKFFVYRRVFNEGEYYWFAPKKMQTDDELVGTTEVSDEPNDAYQPDGLLQETAPQSRAFPEDLFQPVNLSEEV